MLARSTAAAGAGLSSLFVGDHHAVGSPYYQNVPMIARMMAEWDHRDVGALFLLPMCREKQIVERFVERLLCDSGLIFWGRIASV